MKTILDDRALVLEGEGPNAIVASDLHIGYSSELYQTKGISVPIQHQQMLKRLLELIDKYQADSLYILGDLKHTITVDHKLNWEVIPEFLDSLSDYVCVTVIPGNHDGNLEPLLPRRVIQSDVRGCIIGDNDSSVGLVHGHAWPNPSILAANLIVMGHCHPSISRRRFVDAPDVRRPNQSRIAGSIPVAIRTKLMKNCVRSRMGWNKNEEDSEGNLLVLPAFNWLISGTSITRPDYGFQGPFFDSNCVDIASSQFYSIDGIFLGSMDILRESNEIVK